MLKMAIKHECIVIIFVAMMEKKNTINLFREIYLKMYLFCRNNWNDHMNFSLYSNRYTPQICIVTHV